jgi:hypothetical protein
MKSSNPHWTFYAEVLERSLKDLETVCSASPGTSEFDFLRTESPAIIVEAREALSALETYLRAFDRTSLSASIKATQH